jgi:hypothetical protein
MITVQGHGDTEDARLLDDWLWRRMAARPGPRWSALAPTIALVTPIAPDFRAKNPVRNVSGFGQVFGAVRPWSFCRGVTKSQCRRGH